MSTETLTREELFIKNGGDFDTAFYYYGPRLDSWDDRYYGARFQYRKHYNEIKVRLVGSRMLPNVVCDKGSRSV